MDAATGLYYYKNRFYDPETGRFLQTDPIGYAAGMNLYRYASNDPANRADPSGLVDEIVVNGMRHSGSFGGALSILFGGGGGIDFEKFRNRIPKNEPDEDAGESVDEIVVTGVRIFKGNNLWGGGLRTSFSFRDSIGLVSVDGRSGKGGKDEDGDGEPDEECEDADSGAAGTTVATGVGATAGSLAGGVCLAFTKNPHLAVGCQAVVGLAVGSAVKGAADAVVQEQCRRNARVQQLAAQGCEVVGVGGKTDGDHLIWRCPDGRLEATF